MQSFLPNTILLFPVPSVFLVAPQSPFPIQGKLEGLGLMGNSRVLRLQWTSQSDKSQSQSQAKAKASSAWRAKIEVLVLELDLSHYWWRSGAIQEKTASGQFGFFAFNGKAALRAELRLIAPHALTVVEQSEEQQRYLATLSGRLKTSSFCRFDQVRSLPPKRTGPIELLPDYLSMVSQGKHQLVLGFDLSQLGSRSGDTCLVVFH